MHSMPAATFANRPMRTGDNLEIMQGMKSECFDLIYLDPLFNSNRHYAAPVGLPEGRWNGCSHPFLVRSFTAGQISPGPKAVPTRSTTCRSSATPATV